MTPGKGLGDPMQVVRNLIRDYEEAVEILELKLKYPETLMFEAEMELVNKKRFLQTLREAFPLLERHGKESGDRVKLNPDIVAATVATDSQPSEQIANESVADAKIDKRRAYMREYQRRRAAQRKAEAV